MIKSKKLRIVKKKSKQRSKRENAVEDSKANIDVEKSEKKNY